MNKFEFLVNYIKLYFEKNQLMLRDDILLIIKALEEETITRLYSPDGTKMIEIKEGETNE